jgi:hypothetical protein
MSTEEKVHTTIVTSLHAGRSVPEIKFFLKIMFIHTKKRKENTVQIRVSNRGGKRRTWLIGCKK